MGGGGVGGVGGRGEGRGGRGRGRLSINPQACLPPLQDAGHKWLCVVTLQVLDLPFAMTLFRPHEKLEK